MPWYSMVAVYILFWTVFFFAVLPWGVRTNEEEGKPLVPGQADSAPYKAHMGKKLIATTLVSAAFFGLFVLNWYADWINADTLLGFMSGLEPAPPTHS